MWLLLKHRVCKSCVIYSSHITLQFLNPAVQVREIRKHMGGNVFRPTLVAIGAEL